MFTTLGAIGLGASIVGFGASLADKWVRDKKMEQTIEKKVNEAVENRMSGITIIDDEEGEEADEG